MRLPSELRRSLRRIAAVAKKELRQLMAGERVDICALWREIQCCCAMGGGGGGSGGDPGSPGDWSDPIESVVGALTV